MASKKPPAKISEHVSRGLQLLQEIADRQAELRELEAQILAQGAGQYCDEAEQQFVTAVGAIAAGVGSSSYALREGEDEKAKLLAGDSFGELFDRKIVYTPKSGFVDRADALLTPAKKRDLLALTYVPGKPIPAKSGYIKWPKA